MRRSTRDGTAIPPCERLEIGLQALAPKANIKKIAQGHGVHFTYVYGIKKKMILLQKLNKFFNQEQ